MVPRPKGQHERPKSEVVSQGEVVLDNPTRSVEVSQASIHNNKSLRSESNNSADPTLNVGLELEAGHKKEKNKKNSEFGNEVEQIPGRSVGSGRETVHEDGGNVGLESERKKHRKKKKNEVGNFENNGVEAEGDDRGKRGTTEEVKKEESKKRKSEEVEEKGVDGSEEQRGKKKKRRKTD